MAPAIPDADIFPHATGAAAEIVAQHQDKADIVLYSGWFCPFVQRSWITLEEKKIPYQYVEINPYRKEPSFLALNPRGLVPTLGCPMKDGSKKPLIESNIISEYLDESFADFGPKLFPSDPYEKARQKVWIDHVTTRIIPAYHRFLQHTPEKPYSLESAAVEFANSLKTWIQEADPEGPYFAGKEFSYVDVALAPWSLRLWVLSHFKGSVGIPEPGQGGQDEEIWNRWRKWVDAVRSRDSVKNTMSDSEHYLPLYQRYAEDKAQSELAGATRQGRGVP